MYKQLHIDQFDKYVPQIQGIWRKVASKQPRHNQKSDDNMWHLNETFIDYLDVSLTFLFPFFLFLSIQVQKLQAILKPMMLRRLKEDVEKKLAPKEETIIEVELTNIQKKYYRAILEKNFAFLSKGAGQANVPNLVNTMMELRKCCNHPYLIKGKIHKTRAEVLWSLE